jgi:deazaflavin-dependent oxidoreductase (nitroreductase family)
MSLMSMTLRVHDAVYKATGGRIGHRVLGVPTLMLTTAGRRSRQPRTTSLVYASDGGDYLVVASKGGSDSAPGWLHNLEANPEAVLQIGRERSNRAAKVIQPSDPDYDRLWAIVNANNSDRYAEYQKLTTRPIPVVALTPRTDGHSVASRP